MNGRKRFNPKRKRRPSPLNSAEQENLFARVTYTGNPAHKRNPGDFGLDPPATPRPDKTLCDDAKIFSVAVARELLCAGIQRGLLSVQERNGFPQNIWAVTEEGVVLEAQLENQKTGAYHGYPIPETDPLRQKVIAWWTNT
ncbi:MAG: hypothetical protein KAI47_12335 [Deltaproteobacteria bacterium]|nr:hypothetical protein [Deltaproteobacteria bacterium]